MMKQVKLLLQATIIFISIVSMKVSTAQTFMDEMVGYNNGTFTDATAFRTASGMGVITGGGFTTRTNQGSLQFMSLSPPSFKGGCGGIHAYFGSFSFINSEQIKEYFKQVVSNAAGVLFQMAVEAMTPILQKLMADAVALTKPLTEGLTDSCTQAQALVDTPAVRGWMKDMAQNVKTTLYGSGDTDDAHAAREKVKDDKFVFEKNQEMYGSSDPANKLKAIKPTNIVSAMLSTDTGEGAKTPISVGELELMISLIGTTVLKTTKDSGGNYSAVQNNTDGALKIDDLLGRLVINSGVMQQDVDWVSCSGSLACQSPFASRKTVKQYIPYIYNLLQRKAAAIQSGTVDQALDQEYVYIVQNTSIPIDGLMNIVLRGSGGGVYEAFMGQFAKFAAIDILVNQISRFMRKYDNRMQANNQVGKSEVEAKENEIYRQRYLLKLQDIVDRGQYMRDESGSTVDLINRLEAVTRTMYARLAPRLQRNMEFAQ